MTKMIKLSLAAAVAATGMTAAVVDNVKVDGGMKLWYETNDAGNNSFFDKNSSGQVVVDLKASADIGMVKVNLGNTTASTLGLEHGVVSSSRSGGSTAEQTLETQNFTGVANLSTTIGKTTIIAGRQALNTPFVFTEGWNATKNTFNAAVLVNKGLIPNSTLIFADVKSGNGKKAGASSVIDGGSLATNGTTNYNGEFVAIGGEFAQISTKIAGVTINASLTELTDTYTWIDATTSVAGTKVTAIYAQIDPAVALGTTTTDADSTSAAAVKVATKVAGINVMAAYSDVSNDNSQANFANLATGGKKTKLPTAGVYTDGVYVSQPDSKAWKIKVSGLKLGSVALAAQYVDCSNDTTAAKNTQEADIIATTKVGNVKLKGLYINRQFDDGSASQDKIRVIASYSF